MHIEFTHHDRNRRNLDTHSNTFDQSTNQQFPPGPRESLTKHRKDTEKSSQENNTAASDPIVQRIRKPRSHQSRDGGSSVHESDEPSITSNTKLDWKRKVSPVSTSVVPTLDCAAKRTDCDSQIESLW